MLSDLVALWRLWKSDSYLRAIGWFNSHFAALPVDKYGDALPWITYAAMRFLEDRIQPQMSVRIRERLLDALVDPPRSKGGQL